MQVLGVFAFLGVKTVATKKGVERSHRLDVITTGR